MFAISKLIPKSSKQPDSVTAKLHHNKEQSISYHAFPLPERRQFSLVIICRLGNYTASRKAVVPSRLDRLSQERSYPRKYETRYEQLDILALTRASRPVNHHPKGACLGGRVVSGTLRQQPYFFTRDFPVDGVRGGTT